jgi:hypothetical protein
MAYRALWVVALTLFLASVVQAVLAHRTLYQDGGHYLVVLLQTKRPTDWFWARHYAQLLTQWPLVLALRAGLTDIEACMTLQAAGAFYVTPLAVLLGLHLAAGERVLQLLVLLFVGLFYSNLDFVILSDSNALAALTLLCSVLLLRRANLGPAGTLSLTGLGILLLRCYESMAFTGVVLTLLCTSRLRQGTVEGKAARALLVLAAALFLAGVVIALDEILDPVSPSNRQQLLADLKGFSWVGSGLVFGGVAAASYLVGLRRGLSGKLGDSLFQLASVAFALQPWLLPDTIAPERHYAARFLTSLPLAALILLAFLSVRGRLRLGDSHLRKALVYLLAVVIAQSVWHFGATRRWSQYLGSFRTALTRHEGFVPHGQIAPELHYANLFHWGWTEPTLSILLSPGGRVRSVFGNRAARWQPFDPTDPAQLPRLERYGVDYSAYVTALRRPPPSAPGSGAGDGAR